MDNSDFDKMVDGLQGLLKESQSHLNNILSDDVLAELTEDQIELITTAKESMIIPNGMNNANKIEFLTKILKKNASINNK